MEPETLIEAARADHPEVVEELERLQGWVSRCLGDEIVRWQGPLVDPVE
jgi:hypothetical protein